MKREQQEDELLLKAADHAEQSQRNPSPLPMIIPDLSGRLQASTALENVKNILLKYQ